MRIRTNVVMRWGGWLVVAGLLVPQGARSQNYWKNTGTGSWSEATNWTGGLPVNSTSARIVNGGTARVDAGGAAAQELMVGGTAGTGNLLLVPGGALSLVYDLTPGFDAGSTGAVTVEGGSLGGRDLALGPYGTGTFTMTGGAVTLSRYLRFGRFGGGGLAEISGGDLKLTGTGQSGVLMAETPASSPVEMTVSGSGNLTIAYDLMIGVLGNATLYQSGGSLGVSNITSIGNGPNTLNRLLCSGGALTTSYLIAGYVDGARCETVFSGTADAAIRSGGRFGYSGRSHATLSITNNAQVRCAGPLYIGGYNSGGAFATGIVTVAGGMLTTTNEPIYVGYYGDGRLALNGGSVTGRRIYVGYQANARGRVDIQGGTTVLREDLWLGINAGATAIVEQAGGYLETANVYVGQHASATSTFTMTGGVLRCATLSGVGVKDFRLLGGTLGADLYGTSMGSLTNRGATISPAHTAIGKSRIQAGGYTELSPSCWVDVQLAGTTQGTTYDWVQVNQTATLAGNLRVSFTNGFDQTVAPTNKFYVMASDTAAAIQGAFANVAPGGRVTTVEGHTFTVYYGANHNGNGAYRVTLTEFHPRPTGTVVIMR